MRDHEGRLQAANGDPRRMIIRFTGLVQQQERGPALEQQVSRARRATAQARFQGITSLPRCDKGPRVVGTVGDGG